MIGVDFIEELIELCVADGESSSLKGDSQLFLVQGTTAVLVYTLEQLPELLFCVFNKDSEFVELDLAVSRGVDGLKDIMEKVVCVFEGMVYFLETLLQASDVYLTLAGDVEGFPKLCYPLFAVLVCLVVHAPSTLRAEGYR